VPKVVGQTGKRNSNWAKSECSVTKAKRLAKSTCLQILRTYGERILTDILWVRNLGQLGTHTH
ncbi:GM19366, partial [Drosophila sechellia]